MNLLHLLTPKIILGLCIYSIVIYLQTFTDININKDEKIKKIVEIKNILPLTIQIFFYFYLFIINNLKLICVTNMTTFKNTFKEYYKYNLVSFLCLLLSIYITNLYNIYNYNKYLLIILNILSLLIITITGIIWSFLIRISIISNKNK